MINENENMTNENNTAEKKFERRPIPKTAFDSEYFTEFLREVRFLTGKGIQYTFVRKTPDYGISQYKYRKTPALFAALTEFYAIIEAEKTVRKPRFRPVRDEEKVIPMPEKEIPAETISPEQIKEAQEILRKAAEQKDDTI